MAPFPLTRKLNHPYVNFYPDLYGHFVETNFVQPAYSAACVPFRWVLRGNVEGDAKSGEIGIAERLQLGWVPDREPDIRNSYGKEIETSWVQERENQLALLDTFFGALRPEESLCFFYAKRTPLSEQSRRVIIGVGRVLSVGDATEYSYSTKNPPLRCVLWERNVGHSIRPGFADGFLFPYQEALALAEQQGINPEEFIAYAPGEHFDSYSYGSELLSHDGAVASLVSCAAALHRIRGRIEGPWDQALAWIDTQLNRLWKARGPYPGLGSALWAFGYEWGFQHGNLLAYEVELEREKGGESDPWKLVDAVMDNPSKLGGASAKLFTAGMRKGWKSLKSEQRSVLQLLGRCAITEDQALRFYDATERADAGIDATRAELLANPYLLFEQDRRSADPIAFGAVDRGLFPDESLRKEFPVPAPSRIDDPADARRVRALVADLLEEASAQGHTLLPRSWVIRRARERELQPPCPLGENVLDATEDGFGAVIVKVATRSGEPAYQVDRLAECRQIIRREILRRKDGKRHTASHDWRSLVDGGIDQSLPDNPVEHELEERAREEKAAALEQLFCSRLSVLIGPAGTGKTTLLRTLCEMPNIKSGGLLLLAPTGKARVRLEEQTKLRGAGRTLAQFLNQLQRYDSDTGAYFPKPKAIRCGDFRTVIVDESSMLTEEQLAALIDSLANVERLVLVGDPRQLPPIGAGRPFVDIVKMLEPAKSESLFPRCGAGYAELTVSGRHRGGESRADVLFAAQFSGQPIDPGADTVFDTSFEDRSDRLRLIEWNQPQELQEKIVEELVRALKLAGADDELGFEESLGGLRYQEFPWAFFWNKYGNNPGAASKAESWQILSPVRASLMGVDAINRMVQQRFRAKVRELAEVEGWGRKIPRPVGRQALLYGDKVINILNQRRRDVWPKPDGETYIANGDIGIAVGQYKTQKFKGMPWKLEIEFSGQLGYKYGYYPGEFGEEAKNPLELAYCLTVHKTQGSEFGMTFVVLTNPCWLLSRELLYTALTRHQQNLIILHQGPLAEYRRYAGDQQSEIARRLTNLFVDPLPREVSVGPHKLFLEEGLIHRTERGELVRSKSELIIADKLFRHGVDYAYEQPLVMPNGRIRYPDFTITDHAAGVTFYWEHLGMLDNPGYQERWQRKLAEYQNAGIELHEKGGGHAGTLIVTNDGRNTGINSASITQLIEELLR